MFFRWLVLECAFKEAGMLDFKKFPRAACPKFDGENEGPHTVDRALGRCTECMKAVVLMHDPERWETHAAED